MPGAQEIRRRNHLVWVGPLVTVAAVVSYFLVFARWPALRDFPWLNLPLTLFGVALSIAAVGRRRRGSRLSSVLAWSGVGLSTIFAALFCFYVFHLSSTLPAPTSATLEMEQARGFALHDQNGRVVHLADLRGKNAVLVFFRGFW